MGCATALPAATYITALNANSLETNVTSMENKFTFKTLQKYGTNPVPYPFNGTHQFIVKYRTILF